MEKGWAPQRKTRVSVLTRGHQTKVHLANAVRVSAWIEVNAKASQSKVE